MDFEAVGGFDENLISGEDLDFAGRYDAYIVTSCRKLDAFGDWCVVRNPLLIWRLARGKHRRTADTFYYDFQR
jgi:hypothetical protein